MQIDISKYKEDFINETKELISILNSNLLAIEKEPSNEKIKNEVYRCIHTIKGMAATMGFQQIQKLCHEIEDAIHKQGKNISSDCINVIFESADIIDKLLDDYKADRKEVVDITFVLTKLRDVLSDVSISKSKFVSKEAGIKQTAVDTIRVDKEFLDEIINMSGEVFINVDRLYNIISKFNSAELFEIVENIRITAGKLREKTLKARIVSVDTLFNRFPRMVRDLAKKYDKEINFIIEGAEIGIDRIILEGIGEALVHIIRNAVYHGIEAYDVREKKGKPRAGKIKLSAKREKEYIIIEIEDDGDGINPETIKSKAIELGILNKEDADVLNDREAIMLITIPGFTTAKSVDEVSGRGVGLDVVKSKVESFSGKLLIESKYNLCTKFILTLPVTISIIQVIPVEVGNEIYAIPFIYVKKILSVSSSQALEKTIVVDNAITGSSAKGLAEETIPLINLSNIFDVPIEKSQKDVVIVESRNKKAAILGSKLSQRERIIIKPLSNLFKFNIDFLGATILSNGRIALILDVGEIITKY